MKKRLTATCLAMSALVAACGGAHEETPQGLATTAPAASAATTASVSFNARVGGQYRAAQHTPRSQTAIQAFKARHEFLAGSDLDGNWPVLDNGQLEPSIALKRRFDYILLAIGRDTEDQLTELLNTMAEEELTPSNATVVKGLWQSYIKLLKVEISLKPDPKSSASMEAYLTLLQSKREELLGKEWATAFYIEENQAFRDIASSH